MATTEIAINTSSWTLISTGPSEGSISSKKSGRQVFIAEAASLPAAGSDLGHSIAGELIYYNLSSGTNLYAKAYFTDNTIVRTE